MPGMEVLEPKSNFIFQTMGKTANYIFYIQNVHIVNYLVADLGPRIYIGAGPVSLFGISTNSILPVFTKPRNNIPKQKILSPRRLDW